MIHPPKINAEPSRFLLGLIGAGIQASRTPPMHEREGDEQGFRLIYQSIDLERLGLGAAALPELLASAELTGFTGLNVTHPCKQAVIPYLDELSADAAALGAVNTVGLCNGRRIGHNTDWWGFSESFKRGLPGAGLSSVVQLGAGGAGAAVAHALMTLGVRELILSDRDNGRAEELAASLNRRFERFGTHQVRVSHDLATEMAVADGLVHCTPTGMDKYPGMPLPAELLRRELWVAEIVYFPLETALLRAARSIGCRTLDGGGMAVFQAVEAFRLFTGVKPDHERMLRHFIQLGSEAKEAIA